MVFQIIFWMWSAAAFQTEIPGGDWKTRFLQEAPAAWEEYFQKGKDYKGTRVNTVTRIGKEATTIDPIRESEWRSNGIYALYIQKELSGPKARKEISSEIYGGNPDYLFKLSKTKEKQRYILEQINQEPRLSLEDKVGFPPVEVLKTHQGFFNGSIIFHNFSLDTLIKDKKHNFKITGPVERDDKGTGFVRVPFQFEWHIPRVNVHFKCKGVLQLDPDNYWLLQKVDSEIERSGETTKPTQSTTEFVYKNLKGVPLLEKKVGTNLLYSANGQVDQEIKEVTDYKITPWGQPEPADFYLTAFGFPEPYGFKAPRGTLSWSWIVLGGFVLLIVAGFLGWFLRKGKENSIPSKVP